MQWFRMYGEALNDPKVQKLPPEIFKIWVNLLCLACTNNGALHETLEDNSFALHETLDSVSSAFHHLEKVGLLVTVGETFHIKNWGKRQYKSDTSTERVKRFRKRSRNVTVTAPDTEQNRYRTDTEIDSKPPTPLRAKFEVPTQRVVKTLSKTFTPPNPTKIVGRL